MGKILCATRGGEGSEQTQQTAIQLAKETGDPLMFFIAFDLEFLAQADYTLRSDVVNEEMNKMVEFLMAIAVERAEKAGIRATYFVCRGAFREGLIETIRREDVTLVILGRPNAEASKFDLAEMEEFATSVTKETGARVILAPVNEKAP